MTIGPAPIIMIVWMSTRLGIQRFLLPPPCGEVASASAASGWGDFGNSPPIRRVLALLVRVDLPPRGRSGKLASIITSLEKPPPHRVGLTLPLAAGTPGPSVCVSYR